MEQDLSPSATLFLVSPANLSGKRGKLLFNPAAKFELAKRVQSAAGAPLGEVFSFVSGLYFRGKLAYARKFGHALVMTAGGGLMDPDEPVTLVRLRGWQQVSVSEHNPHFTAPLVRQVCELADRHDASARFVLLGSVASRKYVSPLLEALGPRLLFPTQFAGLGDMSRGSLLLKAVSDERELAYSPVATPRSR